MLFFANYSATWATLCVGRVSYLASDLRALTSLWRALINKPNFVFLMIHLSIVSSSSKLKNASRKVFTGDIVKFILLEKNESQNKLLCWWKQCFETFGCFSSFTFKRLSGFIKWVGCGAESFQTTWVQAKIRTNAYYLPASTRMQCLPGWFCIMELSRHVFRKSKT